MPQAKIEKKCPICASSFYIHPSISKVRRCCSRKCQGLWKRRTRISANCLTCNKTIELRPSDIKVGRKYCSKECTKPMYSRIFMGNKHRVGKSSWSKGKYGKDSPTWKGGPKENRRNKGVISTWQYKQWRTAVFERDNYTCQICEQYSGVLHADHIKRWADNEELRYNVDNGRTLCVPCHYYITFKRKMKPGTNWCNFTARKVG